jgi:hypothetical protein
MSAAPTQSPAAAAHPLRVTGAAVHPAMSVDVSTCRGSVGVDVTTDGGTGTVTVTIQWYNSDASAGNESGAPVTQTFNGPVGLLHAESSHDFTRGAAQQHAVTITVTGSAGDPASLVSADAQHGC